MYGSVYLIAAFLIPQPPIPAGGILDERLLEFIGVFFIVSSIGFYFAIRGDWFSPKTLCWVGFAFHVYGAIGIEIGVLTRNGDPDLVSPGLSWTAVWIVSFPLFVPTSPRFALFASTMAASARPLMLFILWLEGVSMPEPALTAHLPARPALPGYGNSVGSTLRSASGRAKGLPQGP